MYEFLIKEYVNKLRESQGIPNPPPGFMPGMMGGIPNPFMPSGPVPGGSSSSGIFPTSLDDYVKKLDEKIAELEKEEAEEKAKKEKMMKEESKNENNTTNKTEDDLQKDMLDILNHNLDKKTLSQMTNKEDNKTQQPTYETIEKPKVNVDVDSVVVKEKPINDEDFFDDFFGNEDE